MPLPIFNKKKLSGIPQQYILDLAKLMLRFKCNKTLTYLEVGAYNGLDYSNTLCLHQELGWNGLLVEPIKHYFEECLKNRPNDTCVNALLSSNETAEMLILKAGPMSQVATGKNRGMSLGSKLKRFLIQLIPRAYRSGREEWIRTTTVNNICAENDIKELNFISCDVEGMEHLVLNGINFNKLDVLAILVEVRPHNIMSILELLLPAGFVCAEAMSRFNEQDNPLWDGSHQDFLFLRRDFMAWAANDD